MTEGVFEILLPQLDASQDGSRRRHPILEKHFFHKHILSAASMQENVEFMHEVRV